MIRKTEIILQSILIPRQQDETGELYYRLIGTKSVNVEDDRIELGKGTILSTQTYLNIFDSWAWNRYTGLETWKLRLEVEGKLYLRLYGWGKKKNLLFEEIVDADEMMMVEVKFRQSYEGEMIYFEIEALEDTILYQGAYLADILLEQKNPVHLSVVICTYKRKKELYQNLAVLKNSMFFDENSPYYGEMSIRIVDNGEELPNIANEYIALYHNPNTGGSGGFTRGLLESRKDEAKYGITHVVFMDDDVRIQAESFYRLYALLCLLGSSYQKEVVAGRMFRLDRRYIQHTAAEIWNQGDVIHLGSEMDMRKEEALLAMNQKLGQYAGWWFACYPMSFARQETPLHFFLHCDDVEYGLRHGGNPLLLNGIQVWHETYENRVSPLIHYYDQRNSMIVNTLYQEYQSEKELFQKWFFRVIYDTRAKKFENLYPTLVAMQDYLKGNDFFLSHSSKKNMRVPRILKGWMALPWILLQIPILRCRIRAAYQSYNRQKMFPASATYETLSDG